MKLRKHQIRAKGQLLSLIKRYGVAYLVGEVRSGKTFTSLSVAATIAPRGPVLFVTGKKAIKDIQGQHRDSGLNIRGLTVINYESLHKVKIKPRFIVLDEAHRLSKFPKPSKAARLIREKFSGVPALLMSGTPSPESFSQLFHQFWAVKLGPWAKYKKFYDWAKKYVDIQKKFVGAAYPINDYTKAKKKVVKMFNDIKVVMTQKQAGFKGEVKEVIHVLDMPVRIALMLSLLKRTEMIQVGPVRLVSDTASKLMSQFHQLCSGTVIDENGDRRVVNAFKADYIKEKFKGRKIAIFYVFVSEGDMLKKMFKNWTNDPEEFNKSSKKVFICQTQSGKLGVNISTADDLIFFNMSFSAETYWQARARTITKETGDKPVHFLFTDGGLEAGIYEVVTKEKRNYTVKHFNGKA